MNWDTYTLEQLHENQSYRIMSMSGYHLTATLKEGKFISNVFGEIKPKIDKQGKIFIFK